MKTYQGSSKTHPVPGFYNFVNGGVWSCNFLTFKFDLIDMFLAVSLSQFIGDLNHDNTSHNKIQFFWLNPYKTVIIVFCLVEMLC